MGPRALDLAPLIEPRSIAVVDASQRMARATRVVRNLQHFGSGGWITGRIGQSLPAGR